MPTGQPVLIVASASGFESHEEWASAVQGHVGRGRLPAVARAHQGGLNVTGEIPLLTTGGELGLVRLAPAQIAALPSLGERDIFRTMQLLPGVSGSNETSSGLYVRGGTPDQTLVTYDGFTVYHVDHLFGYFTAFNMEAVEDVELRKGAYEARYGGRLSSVMECTDAPGRRTAGRQRHREHAQRRRQRSVPIASRGALLLAGRRSFQSPLYNDILDLFGSNGNGAEGGGFGAAPGPTPGWAGRGAGGGFGFDTTPSSHFYDLNGKLSVPGRREGPLALSTYGGRDNLDNSSTLAIPEFTPGHSGRWIWRLRQHQPRRRSASRVQHRHQRHLALDQPRRSFTWSRQWSERSTRGSWSPARATRADRP